MRFRLTYEGELRSSQKDPINGQNDKLAEHKHSIRKIFHKQLKHLWSSNKFLREHRMYPDANVVLTPANQGAVWGGEDDSKIPMSEWVAGHYVENNYRFVPLVREENSLLCSLNILFLRRDIPGSVISAGDLDNRIKTLIDSLRRPRNGRELRGNENPEADENPFFCLLEDDKLVSQLSVETDTLLDPPGGNKDEDQRRVKLFITVDLKPYDVTMFNLSFA